LGDGVDYVTQLAPSVPHPVAGKITFVAISAHADHVCGIATGGAAYCWGANQLGQLGNGSTASSNRPVAVAGELRFKVISVGAAHTCAVTTDGAGYCWGANPSGQLGNGVAGEPVLTPTRVAGDDRSTLVSAGGQHTCALDSDAVAFCWGLGIGLGEGALGYPARFVPVRVAGP